MRVEAITDGDLDRVSHYLNAHMDRRVPAEDWRRSFSLSRRFSPPNHGMMLTADDRVVGVYLAYYSERAIDGRSERFCNLGSWCVDPDRRFHAARLLKALLAQPGYHFTDLSPNKDVIPINERLGFRVLDSRSMLFPTMPWPWAGRVTGDPAAILAALDEPQRRVYLDHRDAAPMRHVLLRGGSRPCYVAFRVDRRTKATGYVVSVLHVSDRDGFRENLRPFLGYLLLRHAALAVHAEMRIVGHRPRVSIPFTDLRRKMVKSADLDPERIDYFYSELVTVPW